MLSYKASCIFKITIIPIDVAIKHVRLRHCLSLEMIEIKTQKENGAIKFRATAHTKETAAKDKCSEFHVEHLLSFKGGWQNPKY